MESVDVEIRMWVSGNNGEGQEERLSGHLTLAGPSTGVTLGEHAAHILKLQERLSALYREMVEAARITGERLKLDELEARAQEALDAIDSVSVSYSSASTKARPVLKEVLNLIRRAKRG